MDKIYRYPGVKPFTFDDRKLYFGRDEDIENLSQLISLERLLILYGKSGIGKTSLLNAGVIPRLQKEKNCEIYTIRFGGHIEGKNLAPLEILKQKISETPYSDTFLDKIKAGRDSLWYYFKSLQINHKSDHRYLLVFDQFEEIFTYPEEEIEAFKRELSGLLNHSIARNFKKALKENLAQDKNFLSDNELTTLYQPFDLKAVISIRSDRMSLLDKFKDYLPDILLKSYELKPLSINQARAAILEPSKAVGPFLSPPFAYEPEAIQKILRYLSTDNTQKIESFQLQILCQSVEQYSIRNKDLSISADDLGDLNQIYKNYYDDQIALLTNSEDRQAARILIEEGLIFEPEERRISLYEGQIYRQYNITPELLKKLVKARLLRAEPNTAGGYSFELCHDTLVAPILKAKQKRKKEEALFAAVQKEKKLRKKRLKERRRLLTTLAIFAVAAAVSFIFAIWAFKQKRIAEAAILSLEQQTTELRKANQAALIAQTDAENSKRVADIAAENAEKEKTRAEQALQLAESERERAVSQSKILLDEGNWLNKEKLDPIDFDHAVDYLIQVMRKEQNHDHVIHSMELATNAKNTPNTILALERAKRARELHYNQLSDKMLEAIVSGLIPASRTLLEFEDETFDHFALSPDSATIALASVSQLRLIDRKTSTIIKSINVDSLGEINSILFSPDSRYLATSYYSSSKVNIWDLNADKEKIATSIATIVENERVAAMAISSNNQIVTGTQYGNLKLWTVKGDLIRELTGLENKVYYHRIESLKFDKSGKNVLAVKGEKAFIINLASNTLEEINNCKYIEHVDNNQYLAAHSNGDINLWEMTRTKIDTADLAKKDKEFESKLIFRIGRNESLLGFSPNRKYVLTKNEVNYYEKAYIWNIADSTKKQLAHNHKMIGAFFLDTDHLLTGVSSGTIQIWKLNPYYKNTESLMADMPRLSFGERLQHNLTSFEEVLESGNLEEKKEAAQYYKNNAYLRPEFYDRSIQLYSGDDEAYYGRAQHYYRQKEYHKAITDFKAAIQLNNSSTLYYKELGGIHLALKNYDQAIDNYKKILEINKRDKEAHYNIGYLYYLKLEYDQALQAFEKALDIDPKYLDALYIMSIVNTEKGVFDQAFKTIDLCLAIDSTNDRFYYLKGYAYSKQENAEAAVEWYLKATQINPYLNIYNDLGIQYEQIRKTDKAIEAFKNALNFAKHPDHKYPNYNLGRIYYNEGDFQQAINYFQQALAIDSMYSHAHNYLGLAFQNNDNLDQAIESYNKAIATDPTNKYPFYNLGKIYFNKEKYAKAISYCGKAIKIDTNYTLAWELSFQSVEKLPEKESLTKEMINWAGPTAFYEHKGRFHLDLREFQKAIDNYSIAIDLNPENYLHYENRGFCYEQLTQLSKAKTDFETARNLREQMENLSNNSLLWVSEKLASIEYSLGNYPKAIFYAKEVHTIRKNNAIIDSTALARACGNLSFYLLFNRQFEDAEQYAQEGLKLDKKEDWIYTNLALSKLLGGKKEDALELYREMKDKDYTEDDSTGDEVKKFRDAFLNDIVDMEEANKKKKIIPEARERDLREVKEMLEKKN